VCACLLWTVVWLWWCGAKGDLRAAAERQAGQQQPWHLLAWLTFMWPLLSPWPAGCLMRPLRSLRLVNGPCAVVQAVYVRSYPVGADGVVCGEGAAWAGGPLHVKPKGQGRGSTREMHLLLLEVGPMAAAAVAAGSSGTRLTTPRMQTCRGKQVRSRRGRSCAAVLGAATRRRCVTPVPGALAQRPPPHSRPQHV
jgi:hypothetical protein